MARAHWVILAVGLALALGVAPVLGNDYLFSAILIPLLTFALAAYNFQLRVPGLPLLASFVLGGLTAAAIGVVFGLPSLRIKGFYLIVSTLAAQFFVQWALTKFSW